MKEMKKNINFKKYIQSLLLLVGMAMGLALVSCNPDDSDGSLPPVIERIRNTNPDTADSAFVSASLGSTLAIIGQNLGTTEAVFLNDYPLGVNPAFVTNNTIIIQVSDSVPTIATNPDVPNKLRVVTKFGEAIMDFQTLPPAPQILRVKNQFVKPGDELTLSGRYFFFVDTVYFPGEDVFVTSGFQTNSSGTSLRVIVPENVDFSEGNNIAVVTKSGGSSQNRNTQIYDGIGMIADFDTNGALEWPWNWGWGISGEMIRSTQPGIAALDNNFGGMNMAFPAGYGWSNDKVINLANWGGAQIFPTAPIERYNPAAPTSQFDIRFEIAVNTTESIEGLLIQVWYPSRNGELQVDVPINNFVLTTDGQWYTTSVNLSTLVRGNVRLNTYADFLAGGGDGVRQLRLLVVNPTAADIKAVVGIDNVRVVRAAY
jgi:hypothetical protein